MELDGSPATAQDLEALALTGYGHFTSMRVDDGGVRGLGLHLARLAADCRAVFGTELDLDRVRHCLRQAAAGRAGAFTIRATVYDPGLTLGNISDPATPRVLITTRPAGDFPPPPLTTKTFVFSRDLPLAKHIGLFSQLRLRRAAQLQGFGDAIFVEGDGRISEGATWNVGFITADGAVVWPDAPVLPGVTMRLLQEASGECSSAPVPTSELADMRAAFATNVSIGVRAISAIDGVWYDTEDSTFDLLRKVYSEIPAERL